MVSLKILYASLALVLFLVCGVSRAAETTPAQKVVEHLHETLLAAMTDGAKLGFRGRAALLRPVVDASFDFDAIVRIVTGRYWKDANPDQRTRFVEAFKQFSTGSYARNFHELDGQKFTTLGSEPDHDNLVVRSEFGKPGSEPVSFNYLLRENNGNWLILNVVAQGVSDLALKRADYAAVIKAEGFDALIDRIKKKVTEMSTAP